MQSAPTCVELDMPYRNSMRPKPCVPGVSRHGMALHLRWWAVLAEVCLTCGSEDRLREERTRFSQQSETTDWASLLPGMLFFGVMLSKVRSCTLTHFACAECAHLRRRARYAV